MSETVQLDVPAPSSKPKVLVNASLYLTGTVAIDTETGKVTFVQPLRNAHSELVMGHNNQDERLQSLYGRLAIAKMIGAFNDEMVAESPTQPPAMEPC